VIAYETGRGEHRRSAWRIVFRGGPDQRLEREALDYFKRIDAQGGVIAALENGYLQGEIAAASYAFQQAVEQGERIVVGVNRFATANENANSNARNRSVS